MNKDINRREFLNYSFAAAVMWAGKDIPASLGSRTDRESMASLFNINRNCPPGSAFPQSVASGDPQPHGIVLWTRISPQRVPVKDRRSKVKVAYEIARDTTFRRPILRGVVETDASRDYAVKTQVNGGWRLSPFQTYYYRFIYGGCATRVGRFKTLPAPNARISKVRFAYLSCQDYTNGYYTALDHLANENVDFVAHLGDYIYETVHDPSFQNNQVRPIKLPSGRDRAETLADYRFLYQKYRTDANLQRVHERFAFISIWDDHEFANDCYRDYDTDTAVEKQNYAPARRQAANQAWAEYIPAGVPFDSKEGPLESLRIYRSLAFGNLMELVMTDERLYRDGPPCGLDTSKRYFTPGCGKEKAPGRTMLGNTQRSWFLDKMKKSPRTWKIWGNETMFMQFKMLNTYMQALFPAKAKQLPPGTGGVYVNLDQWDGYQAERTNIVRELKSAKIKNMAVITGDLHSFIAGYLKENFDNPLDQPVGVCFMGGSVTSSNFAEIALVGGYLPVPPVGAFTTAVKASNPHIQYFNSETHGYNLIEVTPQQLTCTMKAVNTIKAPKAALFTLKTFRVPRNKVQIL